MSEVIHMSLQEIRLELARSHDFPEGHPGCGYTIHAPLTPDGHLDVEGWKARRTACAVRRFWIGEADQTGELIHTRHNNWAISYEPGEEDDTPFFHLERRVFREGEYLTITEQDGHDRTFKVVRVKS